MAMFAYLLNGVVDVGENFAGELIPDEVALAADGEGQEQNGEEEGHPERVEAGFFIGLISGLIFW